MTSIRNDVPGRVRDTAARVVADLGLELFDVEFRRQGSGWVLRVVIDRPGIPAGPETPVTDEAVGIDDCRRVSEDLSALLDVEGGPTDADEQYTLEVSSPGLDRPLRGEADYLRFAGRLAKLVTREPVNGQSHFDGRLAGVDNGAVLLNEGRRVHRVPLDMIRRGRLEVEF